MPEGGQSPHVCCRRADFSACFVGRNPRCHMVFWHIFCAHALLICSKAICDIGTRLASHAKTAARVHFSFLAEALALHCRSHTLYTSWRAFQIRFARKSASTYHESGMDPLVSLDSLAQSSRDVFLVRVLDDCFTWGPEGNMSCHSLVLQTENSGCVG